MSFDLLRRLFESKDKKRVAKRLAWYNKRLTCRANHITAGQKRNDGFIMVINFSPKVRYFCDLLKAYIIRIMLFKCVSKIP